MDEKVKEQLIQMGRHMGAVTIQNAVRTAKTPEEMENQIFVIQACAQHILATHVYNEVRNSDRDPTEALRSTHNDLIAEFDFIVALPQSAEVEAEMNTGNVTKLHH